MHSLPFLFTEGGEKQYSSKANRSLYKEAPKTPERPNEKEKETLVEDMRTKMKEHVTTIIETAQNPDFLDDSFTYRYNKEAREPFAGGEIEYKMRMTWRKNPRRP